MDASCGVEHFLWHDQCYVIHVYRHADRSARCAYTAETCLGPGDKIVTDGRSPDEVLRRLQALLPVALHARVMVGQQHPLKLYDPRHVNGH